MDDKKNLVPGEPLPEPPPTGLELVIAERERQIKEEGFDAEHDKQHQRGELTLAAACYASPVPVYRRIDRYRSLLVETALPKVYPLYQSLTGRCGHD